MKKVLIRALILFFGLALLQAIVTAQPEGTFGTYTGTTHWSVRVTEDETGCGGSTMTYNRAVTIQHNMQIADVSDWAHGPARGTFLGNTLSLPGRTIPDGEGTSVLSAFDIIFSSDCSSFTGSYTWYYSDAYMSCDGSTSLSGTRTGASGCPGASPTPTETPTPTPEITLTPEETPTPEITPTPEETPTPEQTPEATPSPTCAPVPPPCPPISGTTARDPGIASSSLCRGACGPDCPSSCTSKPDRTMCVSDGAGCFYTCTYSILQCGTSESCRTHDDCYDSCAEKGETQLCYSGGFCHCSCDLGCIFGSGLLGPLYCPLWAYGYGPTDSTLTYSTPLGRSGPLQACP